MSDDRAVSVFGAAGAAPDSDECALAERVGAVLASAGLAVASGGYGGAMEAVSRGAAEAGAEVIGVTCRIWHAAPNRFVTRVVETADRYERLRTLIELGRAGWVALPGLTGTLVELAMALELSAKGAAERPLACVGDYWRPVVELLARRRPDVSACARFVADPDELAGLFASP